MPVTDPVLPLYAAEIERTCLPLEQATQLPGQAFTDHEVFEWERANFFRRGWICAGHVDQVRERGALPDRRGGRRERDRDRRRRRPPARVPEHLPASRRAPAHAPEGRTRRLQCPYHAWTLRLRRRAASNAPFTDGLEDFDPALLRPAPRAARRGRGIGPARPLRRRAAAAGAHRRPGRLARRLPPARAAPGGPDRLRGRRELEGDRRELQRVPALPGRAPGAQPALALSVRRDDQGAGRGAAAR